MADGSFGNSPARATSEQLFRKSGALAADRFARDVPSTSRRAVGGYEKPRAEAFQKVSDRTRVARMSENYKPSQDAEGMYTLRDRSKAWAEWMQELARWMKESRARKDVGLTEQLWQSYAAQFPPAQDMALTGAEQAQWDESLEQFFYANPVLRRVQEAVDAMREGRVSPQRAGYVDALSAQLEGLRDQLSALEASSFRGSVRSAEITIMDLQRRLWQEQRIHRELSSRGQGAELSVTERDAVISGVRRQRIERESSAKKARQEYRSAMDVLYRQGDQLRKTLLSVGVPEAHIRDVSLAVSHGDFSQIAALQKGAGQRFSQGWRQGGLFRAFRDAVRPADTALMEHARAFHEARKQVDYWSQEKERYDIADREALGVSF